MPFHAQKPVPAVPRSIELGGGFKSPFSPPSFPQAFLVQILRFVENPPFGPFWEFLFDISFCGLPP